MPEGRFYDEYIEERKKDKHRKIKKKISNRLILVILIILLAIYLIAVNIQNRTRQKEEILTVDTAETYSDFDEATLSTGEKITIERIIIEGTEGIAYIVKEMPDGKKQSIAATPTKINQIDNTIEIHEESLNLKIDLKNKIIEELGE